MTDEEIMIAGLVGRFAENPEKLAEMSPGALRDAMKACDMAEKSVNEIMGEDPEFRLLQMLHPQMTDMFVGGAKTGITMIRALFQAKLAVLEKQA